MEEFRCGGTEAEAAYNEIRLFIPAFRRLENCKSKAVVKSGIVKLL